MPFTAPSKASARNRLLSGLLFFLTVSAAYLYGFPQPTVFYAAVVLLHAVAGVVAAVVLIVLCYGVLRRESISSRVGWLLIAVGAVLGLILVKTGTPRTQWNLLYTHILLSVAGIGILFAEWAGERGWLSDHRLVRCAVVFLSLAALGFGARYLRESRWQHRARIENPAMPPASMDGEGDGPSGPFFPSSAQVYG